MPPLIECIPNFSEGRAAAVIAALISAIETVPNVKLLHHTADVDHNRSVITFAGSPDAVVEAAFQSIKVAAEKIDLEQQRGVHPRLGAADVVPLVPLRGLAMADCIQWARHLGQRVGTELQLPVYLYEAAATRPERVNLAHVRRGEYEGLKQTIHTPERQPDFGPAQISPAGAVIIGARPLLIAFNVYLAKNDLNAAKMIARHIRESSGGLPGIKALGLFVHGRTQVSMNITDFRRTSIFQVMRVIRELAAQYDNEVAFSELIGLIPQAALINQETQTIMPADVLRFFSGASNDTTLPLLYAADYLQLADFTPDDVLEIALENAGLL